MSYAVKDTKEFSHPVADVAAAAGETITQLGGKRSKKDAGIAGEVHADFNKEIGGRAFTNRVHLIARVTGDATRGSVVLEAYPVDPLGNQLQFGVVGEPAKLVTGAIWQRLEARLAPAAK